MLKEVKFEHSISQPSEQLSPDEHFLPKLPHSVYYDYKYQFQAKALKILHFQSQQIVKTKAFENFERKLSCKPDPDSFQSMIEVLSSPSTYSDDIKVENEAQDYQFGGFTKVEEKAFFSFDQFSMNPGFGSTNIFEASRHFPKNQSTARQETRSFKRGDLSLEIELEKMARFILENMGKDNFSTISKGRSLYEYNPLLIEAYDALAAKYYSSKKVKEDFVRYIIRKALKSIKQFTIGDGRVQGKEASLLLLKKYFPDRFEQEMQDEKLVELLLPYHEKSKNRTITTNLVHKIFSSDEFHLDYQRFLPNLNGLLNKDKEKKLKKLVLVLLDCAKKREFSKIANLKVFPWLDNWIEETKNIAQLLSEERRVITNEKRLKRL